jgi:hypothetical protein
MAYRAAHFVTPSVFVLALAQLVLRKKISSFLDIGPFIFILATEKERNSSQREGQMKLPVIFSSRTINACPRPGDEPHSSDL